MTELSQQKCEACSGDAERLSSEEIEQLKPKVPQWQIVEVEGVPHLTREFKLNDFQSALQFTNQVGEVAEAQGHHPAILTEWGKVKVSWWTHAISGLHQNDFIMAAKTDEISQKMG